MQKEWSKQEVSAPLQKQGVVPKKVPLSESSATEDDILCRPCGDAFYSGDRTWPVAPQHLIDFCGKASGLAGTASKERWNHRESHVVPGREQLIPDSRTFHRRFSCLQRHLGLCVTKDSLIYDAALQCSKNLERWCCHFNAENRFVRVVSNAAQLILYVAGRRARRPFAPQAWVFALCSFTDGPEAGELRVTFVRRRPAIMICEAGQPLFFFLSVWSVAKHFLADVGVPIEEIHIGFGVHKWLKCDGSPQIILSREPDLVKVYPGIWKPEKVDGGAMDMIDGLLPDEVENKPKKDRSGGCKARVCNPFVKEGSKGKSFESDSEFSGESGGSETGGEEEMYAEAEKKPRKVAGDSGSVAPPKFRGGDYKWIAVEGGFLVWSEENQTLDAHCRAPGHKGCKCDRTVRPGRDPDQGRPAGRHMAWLKLGLHCS